MSKLRIGDLVWVDWSLTHVLGRQTLEMIIEVPRPGSKQYKDANMYHVESSEGIRFVHEPMLRSAKNCPGGWEYNSNGDIVN